MSARSRDGRQFCGWRSRADERSHDARLGQAPVNGDSEFAELRGDEVGGISLLESGLRVSVQIAPPGRELFLPILQTRNNGHTSDLFSSMRLATCAGDRRAYWFFNFLASSLTFADNSDASSLVFSAAFFVSSLIFFVSHVQVEVELLGFGFPLTRNGEPASVETNPDQRGRSRSG